MENFFKVVDENFQNCETLLKIKNEKDYVLDQLLVFDFFPFELLLTRFINTRWELLPMAMLETIHEALHSYRNFFLPIHQGWHILRINPTSEANHNFFQLVEAAAQSRQEEIKKIGEDVLAELRKVSYTITYSPKSS